MDMPLHALCAVLICYFLFDKSASAVDKDLTCGVCRALVDEVNFEISKVDPKKKIQVGSFRVDSRGNQGTYEKSYARSEVHLMEIFENICDIFKKYAESQNSAGKRSIARIEARQDGQALALKNIKMSAETQKLLKFACEQMVEEHEDDMIALFSKEEFEGIEKAVCADLTSLCTEADLAIPMPQTEMDESVEILGDKKDTNNDDDDDDDDDVATEGMVEDDSDTEEADTEDEDDGPDVKVNVEPVNIDDVDPDLIQQYMNDMAGDSVPADTVMNKKFSGKNSQKKEEL